MNFFTNYKLTEYLNKYSQEKRNEIIKKNALKFVFNRITNNVELFSKEYVENKACYLRNFSAIFHFKNIIKEFNMCPVFFKGIILAEQLYENPFDRMVADIDLIVPNSDIKEITQILKHKDFNLKSENEFNNKHHWSFIYKGIIYEVHLHILNPMIEINESFILSNIIEFDIHGDKVYTFNITATLLHLVYHLYMDTCLSSNNIYAISAKTTFGTANRFLYRAYEIALFAEKFFDDIKWDDIISDIKTQKLRIIFKYMVEDILEIFPNAFPAKLVDAINSLEYVGQQNDDVYKIIRTDKAAHDNNVDFVLSKYIDENWNYNNTTTCKRLGECFKISKPVGEEPSENKTLSCELLIDRCEEGISLQFTVSDDDFYVSDCNNFGTLESDGVHLLLCGTQKYTYMSIFLVPKIKNDSIEVLAYDVLNNTVIDSMDIQARIQKYDDYYILQAVLSNEFLSRYEIDKYFYVGFVVSDCDRETKYRKNALISSDPEKEWYNPLHFLKIDLLD